VPVLVVFASSRAYTYITELQIGKQLGARLRLALKEFEEFKELQEFKERRPNPGDRAAWKMGGQVFWK
jgi:hypothetical protein